MADPRCGGVDCRPPAGPRAPAPFPRPPQAMDYMARDYDSYLRALLDLLPARVPGWRDRSEADLGMALLELFAFVGDQLTYYQDRVALEGWLRTATQHDSVRRLLRLVDYTPDPGRAARVELVARATAPAFLPAGFRVSTLGRDGTDGAAFETEADRVVLPELNELLLFADAPDDPERTRVTVAAVLDDGHLPAGSRLLLEDGERRQWVTTGGPQPGPAPNTTRLVLTAPLAETWPAATARVRGNALAATHGVTRLEVSFGTGAPGQAAALLYAPLTFTSGPAGEPVSSLRVEVDGERWTEAEDFLDSTAEDPHYRLSRDNEGGVTVHFGDGAHGRVPGAGASITLRYREGIGEAGQVAAGTLVVHDDLDGALASVVNPLASDGGREPESVDQARLLGPRTLRRQNRAVTPGDYEAVLLEGVPGPAGGTVRALHARARARWTGSWTTMVVSVDLPGRPPLDAATRRALEAALARRRLAGRDVRVESARYAPLHLRVTVHVRPGAFARQVRQGVERALSG
ncbi:MAG TPA: hypothetical protein VF142_21070, partial [Longimicrobium sp.]